MDRPLIKILFHLAPASWHQHATECLWANEVAPGRYQLRNSPLYAYDVSFEDIVNVQVNEAEQFVFAGVSLRSGHSTYRVMLKSDVNSREFGDYWRPLQEIGCTYEGKDGKLLAVDVPARADVYRAYQLLQTGEKDGVWQFEEGHCGHAVG